MTRHRPHLLVDLGGSGDRVVIDEAARHHLERVLRYPDGGPVTYTNGAGLIGSGALEGGAIVRGDEHTVARGHSVTVAAAPPHEHARQRFLVEKLGELGVTRLLWLHTAHGQVRPPKPDKARAWARASLEQSRGAWLLAIGDLVRIDELVRWGTPVFADRGGAEPGAVAGISNPVLGIGPEGGFALGELPEGAVRVQLGDTVLRVETAAVVGAALLQLAGTFQEGSEQSR